MADKLKVGTTTTTDIKNYGDGTCAKIITQVTIQEFKTDVLLAQFQSQKANIAKNSNDTLTDLENKITTLKS